MRLYPKFYDGQPGDVPVSHFLDKKQTKEVRRREKLWARVALMLSSTLLSAPRFLLFQFRGREKEEGGMASKQMEAAAPFQSAT